MIYDWARKFEQEYDPCGEKDHSMELETQGPRWLLDTFPYTPEMDDKRQFILEFIEFEASTAEIWPWALSMGEMIQNEELLQKVEKAVQFDAAGSCDTDELYEALDKIVGVNPELRDKHTFSLGMSST